MRRNLFVILVSTGGVLTLVSCGESPTPTQLQAHSFALADWSEPVNLGPMVNSPSVEEAPVLSNDGLTLYFMSQRPGGAGPSDLWAAHRACSDCPWEPPVNLVAVNGPQREGGPALSRDGHLLFFQSNRSGSQLLDIYLASRADPNDDLGWGPAVRLGPDVNTPLRDILPWYSPIGEGDAGSLYFSRGATTHDADIYVVSVTRDGVTLGPAVSVTTLNDPDPTVDETRPSLRSDGREMVFRSNRTGSLGEGDLWVATRPGADAPWSAPVNLGASLNTVFDEATPSLSFDGRTLLFVSNRPGGQGDYDIWMVTRSVNDR